MNTFKNKLYLFNRIAIVFVLLISTNYCEDLRAQKYELSNITELDVEADFFQHPQWSPDGEKILTTGINKKGLYIVDNETYEIDLISKEAHAGRNARWLNSTQIIYSKKGEFKNISLQDTRVAESDTNLFIYVNLKERKLYAHSITENKDLLLLEHPANYYNPVLSPDGKKLAIHIGASIYIVPTDGSGTMEKLGTGIANSWSPDSKDVFYFMDQSIDGHCISNSDIYFIDTETKQAEQLSFTDNRVEMWPSVSPDGSRILFTDESQGKIYIADLKKQ